MKPTLATVAWVLCCSLVGLTLAPAVQADNHAATKAKLEAAMAAEIRSAAERERDRNRKPVATLEFFGLRDDMKVVELTCITGPMTNCALRSAAALSLAIPIAGH